ncbi:MAG TPA: serine/threonine-protein kinase [Kofleriaceae bacterium]|nr:serine/threonine-protein kinase [Kofleriaceae bacterium]
MSSTPEPRYVCPRCRTAFTDLTHFCTKCGADMTRASALEASAHGELAADTDVKLSVEVAQDRRVTESNRAWLGKVVEGRYRVLEVIGRGGMGVVYRVEHLRMGKIAAMKVLHRELANDRDAIERFEREAAAVSRLQHPHTVQVFDFGQAQGALYLIMEYVRGQDLAHIINRDGAMPWARAAPILAQICGALQEAHELGVVHRDLKPENVLIGRTTGGRDFAKVLDFGLAKLDGRQLPASSTDRQEIMGTPYFMSPEQIRGDEVDARGDLYSFGALMFNLLTGQNLYTAANAVGVLTKHLTAEPDAPSQRAPTMGIDPRVDHICRKALARDPAQRWQSAAELGAEIEEAYRDLVGESTNSGRGGSRSLGGGKLVLEVDESASDLRLRRSDLDAFERSLRRRKFTVWAVAAMTVAGIAAGAGWYLTRQGQVLTREREPNNEPGEANFVAFGRDVFGLLGKRRSKSEGDLDVFEVKGAAARQLFSAEVTGIPNIDLSLRVMGREGRAWVTVDEGGVGEGEQVFRRMSEGSMLVAIESRRSDGQTVPTENVSDDYRLRVTLEAPDAGWEAEPNASAADANPLTPRQTLRGRLDSRGDVDVLRWSGPEGMALVEVQADGLPLAWQTPDGQVRAPGAVQVKLRNGDHVRLFRTDQAGRKGDVPGRTSPWSVTVTPQ